MHSRSVWAYSHPQRTNRRELGETFPAPRFHSSPLRQHNQPTPKCRGETCARWLHHRQSECAWQSWLHSRSCRPSFSLQTLAIDNRFGKFAHLEQGRDAAHGFRVAQAKIAAWIQRFVESI